MNTSIQLRPYQDQDWPALCDIHDASRKLELQASGLLDAFLTLEQTAESEGLFDGELWVACVANQPVGFAAFSDGELTWLYVAPGYMRQGIGRALLAHAIERCSGTLSTECLVGNSAALALYLHMGFEIEKRVDGKLTGNESFAASGYILRRSYGMHR